MAKNLDQVRAASPSTGFTDDSIFLKRRAGVDYGETGEQVKSGIMLGQFTTWTAGTTPAQRIRVHNGKICLSIQSTTSAPGSVSDENWLVFSTTGDLFEHILYLLYGE